MDIKDWLSERVPTIGFDCMDFPHDSEAFYDCYFQSGDEETDASRLDRLLKQTAAGTKQIEFSVGIVDGSFRRQKNSCRSIYPCAKGCGGLWDAEPIWMRPSGLDLAARHAIIRKGEKL